MQVKWKHGLHVTRPGRVGPVLSMMGAGLILSGSYLDGCWWSTAASCWCTSDDVPHLIRTSEVAPCDWIGTRSTARRARDGAGDGEAEDFPWCKRPSSPPLPLSPAASVPIPPLIGWNPAHLLRPRIGPIGDAWAHFFDDLLRLLIDFLR